MTNTPTADDPHPDPFESLRSTKTVLLTTYRRDGTPVGTPVSIAFDGDRAFFRTWDAAGKVKRLARNRHVRVAPSTFRGAPTGSDIFARARRLSGAEARVAARALGRRHRVLQRALVPLTHRLMRYRTVHYELMPLERADPGGIPFTRETSARTRAPD
jgi:PPOX class probable F420-dependent enzyme